MFTTFTQQQLSELLDIHHSVLDKLYTAGIDTLYAIAAFPNNLLLACATDMDWVVANNVYQWAQRQLINANIRVSTLVREWKDLESAEGIVNVYILMSLYNKGLFDVRETLLLSSNINIAVIPSFYEHGKFDVEATLLLNYCVHYLKREVPEIWGGRYVQNVEAVLSENYLQCPYYLFPIPSVKQTVIMWRAHNSLLFWIEITPAELKELKDILYNSSLTNLELYGLAMDILQEHIVDYTFTNDRTTIVETLISAAIDIAQLYKVLVVMGQPSSKIKADPQFKSWMDELNNKIVLNGLPFPGPEFRFGNPWVDAVMEALREKYTLDQIVEFWNTQMPQFPYEKTGTSEKAQTLLFILFAFTKQEEPNLVASWINM